MLFELARAYICATIMAEEEDDYLSDKFLVDSALASSQPKTYAQRRKEAQKQAQIKNEENKLKSRRQRELESREEGLSKSLFERAKEEEASGIGTGNKALSMMMKMGFKPGQALGKPEDDSTSPDLDRDELLDPAAGPSQTGLSGASQNAPQHKTEPIPINEWMGKFYCLYSLRHINAPHRQEGYRAG